MEKPLRLYFSSVEGHEAPIRRPSGRRSHAGGRAEPSENKGCPGSEGAFLWFSIYPAVPLELAHLLLHDMPVPHLAPHLRMFEQRQLAQQQEEHQQLLRQIQRQHEGLARDRALRQERQQAEAGDEGAPQMQAPRAGTDNLKGQTGSTIRQSIRSGSTENPGAQKVGQFTLHRIPVKPLWWANGDWLYREVRLSQLLGPFFYRQLMRLRGEEELAESPDTMHEQILDPRGELFEDITCA